MWCGGLSAVVGSRSPGFDSCFGSSKFSPLERLFTLLSSPQSGATGYRHGHYESTLCSILGTRSCETSYSAPKQCESSSFSISSAMLSYSSFSMMLESATSSRCRE
ncbi:hypothetical protein ElyMa_003209100 [Elysia marginata]|uniref:Secreted protein n=1 Tax=Elysia marginata TaxID=1093978 RepID=A0AAV4J1Q5_9GAST|nr:hypothetical protein ElyMa_003209100 [Elysia marginata]